MGLSFDRAATHPELSQKTAHHCVTLPPMSEILSEKQLAGLNSRLELPVLTAGGQDYECARRVWNGMIDRRPSMIVRPASIADVMQALRFVRENQLPFTVRGGGHSVSGKSVADGAVMIDLSRMNAIQIDPAGQSAVVQGGATWGAFDKAAESDHLATTGGVITGNSNLEFNPASCFSLSISLMGGSVTQRCAVFWLSSG